MEPNENARAESSATPTPARDIRQTRSRLLGALLRTDYDRLAPSLERLHVDIHHMLAKQNERFTHVYFPETCVISLVSRMSDGAGVEVGTIGNEGMAGLPAYFEADTSETDTFCQVAGEALRAPVEALIDVSARSSDMRKLLNRYAQAYMVQVSQSVACNRLHNIEQRCARWLLMTHDRVYGADSFPLKHEFLALMLGVRRAGVSTAAAALQKKGLIRYRRGVIRVVDREGLVAASCECYGIVRRQFDRLIP